MSHGRRHGRVSGINSIANALLGNTSLLASQRGFRNEAFGQSSIASALFNRSRALTDSSNRNFRNESLTRLRATNPDLFNALAGSTSSNPNQIGQFLKQMEGIRFGQGAEEQFRGTPAGPEGQEAVAPNVPLGSLLSSLASGIQTPGQITVSPTAGRVNRFSGESLDPRLLEASTQKREFEAEGEAGKIEKIDAQILKIHAQTGKITVESAELMAGGGQKPATGSAKLGFHAKMQRVWTDANGRFPQFEDPNGDERGPKFRKLTPKQQGIAIDGYMNEILRVTPEQAIEALQNTPSIDAKDLEEAAEFVQEDPGYWERFTGWMDDLEARITGDQAQQGFPAEVDAVTGAAPVPPPQALDIAPTGAVPLQPLPPGLGAALSGVEPQVPQPLPEGLGGALANILPRAPEGSGPVFEAQGGVPAQPTPFPGIAPVPLETLTPTAPTAPAAPTQGIPQLPNVDPGAVTKIKAAPTATLQKLKAEIEQLLKSGASQIPEDHKALLTAINNELEGR